MMGTEILHVIEQKCITRGHEHENVISQPFQPWTVV
jgi:hypothetical protein